MEHSSSASCGIDGFRLLLHDVHQHRFQSSFPSSHSSRSCSSTSDPCRRRSRLGRDFRRHLWPASSRVRRRSCPSGCRPCASIRPSLWIAFGRHRTPRLARGARTRPSPSKTCDGENGTKASVRGPTDAGKGSVCCRGWREFLLRGVVVGRRVRRNCAESRSAKRCRELVWNVREMCQGTRHCRPLRLRRKFANQGVPSRHRLGGFLFPNHSWLGHVGVFAQITQTNVVPYHRGGSTFPSNTCMDSRMFPCLLEEQFFARCIKARGGWKTHHRHDLPWSLTVAHVH